MSAASELRPSLRSSAAAFVLVVLALCSALAGGGRPGAAAETGPQPITLTGEGSWGPYGELVHWQDDLYGAKAPIDLSYTSTGSALGRQDFLKGGLDYVISGRPFSADELKLVKGGKAGLIDVPVHVEAMAFLLAVPLPEGFETLTLICDPYDPDVPDPEACLVRTPYEGPIRVPNKNLAAMVFQYSGTGSTPMSSWNDPDVLAAMGVENFTLDPLAGPAPVMRSEPSATNYYLQQFAKQAAPTVWDGIKAADSRIVWEPIAERLPKLSGASRQGVDQQSLQLGLGGADPVSGAISGFTKGIIAPVPPAAKAVVAEAFPATKLEFIEMQNASQEWVSPTPASIDKAVDAGGDDPLHALTNPVPGAYPLVWVNHLYAPATGLSVDKTEALATAIRYLATSGQEATTAVGDGRLSDALVKKALSGADDLVRSNCVGSDRRVVTSSDPGDLAPDLPGLASIGPMLHCEPVGPQPTTTTTTVPPVTAAPPTVPADTTPIVVDPGLPIDDGLGSFPIDDGSGLVTDDTTTDTAGTATTTVAAASTTTAPAVIEPELASISLPLPLPTGRRTGYDRMAALLLGAAAALLFGPAGRKLGRRIKG